MIKILWIPALFILMIGCNSGQKKIDEISSSESIEVQTPASAPELPVAGSLSGDTVNIYGRYLVFYGPETGNSANNTLISDEVKLYMELSSKIIDSLNKHSNISAMYTSVNCIRVYNLTTGKPMTILRNTFPESTGLVMSDGMQAPVIKKGTVTEQDYHLLISKYFLLPS